MFKVYVILLSVHAKFVASTHSDLHVMVSDFLPLFNNTRASSAELPMSKIYGKSFCPGDSAFIAHSDAAPSSFCVSGVNMFDLHHVIGSEWWCWWKWSPAEVSKWPNSTVPAYDTEFDNALLKQLKSEGYPLKFDQFALERIMLARWNHRARNCREQKNCNVGNVPHVIVVRSLLAHMQEQLWNDHLGWNLVVPVSCIPDGSNRPMPAHCKEGYGNIELHRKYWKLVRRTHFRPYIVGGDTNHLHGSKLPLIVVTHSFVWDQPAFLNLLQALYEQPPLFVEHVVITTIESNFKILSSLTEAGFPLRIHSSCSSSNFPSNLFVKKEGSAVGQPLFVTMPYPTGLAVEQPTKFFTEDVKVSRPISLLMDANLDRKGGGGKVMMCWIRQLVRSKLIEGSSGGGSICKGSVCAICQNEVDGSITTCNKWPLYDGKWERKPTMWEALVSSSFCLEPAGDTLTRSHFYAAVLSGCIPVIFDGGVDDFNLNEATCWAWRGDGKQAATLDYSEFTVTYKATDIRDGKVDMVKELMEMPFKQPDRFQRLRRGVDKAAEAMRYSSLPSETHPDAFDHFETLISDYKNFLHSP